MRGRHLTLAAILGTIASVVIAPSVALAAEARDSTTYTHGSYRCTNRIHMYTLGGSAQDVVASASVVCNHTVRRLRVDVVTRVDGNWATNAGFCDDATGCATSKRRNDPAGTQTFEACTYSTINTFEENLNVQSACVRFRT